MFFHVYIFEYSNPVSRRGHSHWFFNVDEGHLSERFQTPWDRGTPITYDGMTFDVSKIQIRIYETNDVVPDLPFVERYALAQEEGEDVTNTWITGPAGRIQSHPVSSTQPDDSVRDPRRVMVVHGRNLAARDAMFTFLRTLGLEPTEWEQAVADTGMGSPHNLEAVRAAMRFGQAVVVLLTPDDRAGLMPEIADPTDAADADDLLLRGQPRQNVILEAGLAMGLEPIRTVLVELGAIRRATDFDGLNTVRMSNDVTRRSALVSRLRTAGCTVNDTGSDWTNARAGGDFDASAISWSPVRVDEDGDEP